MPISRPWSSFFQQTLVDNLCQFCPPSKFLLPTTKDNTCSSGRMCCATTSQCLTSSHRLLQKITALQESAESQPLPLANWFSHYFGPGSKLAWDEFMEPLHGKALIASLIYRAQNESHITVKDSDEPFLICYIISLTYANFQFLFT